MVNEGEPGVGLCQRVIRLGFGDVVDVDGIYIDNRYARPRTNQLGPKPTRQLEQPYASSTNSLLHQNDSLVYATSCD